ncbi:MAG: hypothetical protein ABIK28_20290 [Planctomycetota bacterium]
MKIKIAIFFSALIFTGFFPVMVLSQSWEPVGPSGGSFLGSVSDSADADKITAIMTYPSPSAAYQSEDGGQSWAKIADIPYSSLYHMCAYDYI